MPGWRRVKGGELILNKMKYTNISHDSKTSLQIKEESSIRYRYWSDTHDKFCSANFGNITLTTVEALFKSL